MPKTPPETVSSLGLSPKSQNRGKERDEGKRGDSTPRISLGCGPLDPQNNCSAQNSLKEARRRVHTRVPKEVGTPGPGLSQSVEGPLSYPSLSFSAGVTVAHGLWDGQLQGPLMAGH